MPSLARSVPKTTQEPLLELKKKGKNKRRKEKNKLKKKGRKKEKKRKRKIEKQKKRKEKNKKREREKEIKRRKSEKGLTPTFLCTQASSPP